MGLIALHEQQGALIGNGCLDLGPSSDVEGNTGEKCEMVQGTGIRETSEV